MNEELINDLKQFITATVSQATADLASKEDLGALAHRMEGLEGRFAQLEQRLDARFDELETKLTTIADAHAEELDDFEQRIGRLEAGEA